MFRLVLSIILITAGIITFTSVTLPTYNDIKALKVQMASFSQALDNAKALENERDKLTKKDNAISAENREKIKKLLPDNVDNIRLILEIEQLARPYGMALRDVSYDTFAKKSASSSGVASAPTPTSAPATGDTGGAYGVWNLSFSTQGTYNNFLNFTKNLESNLRIVDISSVGFSSDTGADPKPNFTEVYKYTFKIKTYWLKN